MQTDTNVTLSDHLKSSSRSHSAGNHSLGTADIQFRRFLTLRLFTFIDVSQKWSSIDIHVIQTS